MSTTYKVGVKIEGQATGLARAAKEAQESIKKLGAGAGAEFNKMARSRELLGVRSEHAIQRELQRTEAAYGRMARAGFTSLAEQKRAAEALRAEVQRLNMEMGKMPSPQKMSARQQLIRGAGGAVAVGAGAIAAGAVLAPKVDKALSYDERMGHLANTAFNDRNTAGRLAGKKELDAMVADAVRYGGGNRDTAANTADALFGSGVFNPAEIKKILREAVLAGTANNADASSFAQMAVTAKQNMGLNADQMGRMFGMGTYAGQKGGFEIKDMAKWLPQQMAAAKAVGMYGEAGFAKLAALNQASVNTAGTKDEAGNNVVNLLAKMGSSDTGKDFTKLGINLPQQLAEGRNKGLDALDVVGNLLEQQLAKDKNFQLVQKQLAQAKTDPERRAALGAVGDIAQGTVIGKVFQDRQALMALYAFVNDRARVNTIAQGATSDEGVRAHLKNYDVVKAGPAYAANQFANERELATQKAMDALTPAISGVASGLTGLMRDFPLTSAAALGATATLTALAAAAGVASAAMMLTGGGKAGALLGAGRLAGMAGGAGALASAAIPAATVGAGLFASYEMLQLGGAIKQLVDVKRRDGVTLTPDAQARLRASTPSLADRLAQPERRRGEGFADPRRLDASGRTPDAVQAALQQSMRATEVRGEIVVKVTAAPGLNVQTDINSKTLLPLRASQGKTNQAAGF